MVPTSTFTDRYPLCVETQHSKPVPRVSLGRVSSPAGLAKDHTRFALTAQDVRYAVVAQVGTLEATPAFRLSAAGLHERLSSTAIVGGPDLRHRQWTGLGAVEVRDCFLIFHALQILPTR